MPRQSAIGYEIVATACLDLWRSGINPNFKKVYEAIGNRGSATVVQRLIDKWKKDSAERLQLKQSHADLPDNLTAAGDNLLVEFWKMALTTARSETSKAMESLNDERAANLKMFEKASQEAASLAEEIDALRATINSSTVDLLTTQQELMIVTTQLNDRNDEIRRMQDLVADERKHLMAQTDEIRQGDKKLLDGLKKQLKTSEALVDKYRDEVVAAHNETSIWRKKAVLLQERVSSPS